MPESLDIIASQAHACTLCEPHLALGANPVFQVSNKAKILIAGQAPGTAVHASGRPFDDPSGDRLRQWLPVSKEQFYDPNIFAILPMGFCYPGKGKSGDLPPRPECAETWRREFLDAMPQIELTLAIGQYAQAWHLPNKHKTLTETVKHWQDYWPRVLPLPHPSPRNNIWLKKNPWFENEVLPSLQKAIGRLLGN